MMKKVFALTVACLIYVAAFSQTVIENPVCGLSTVPYVNIKKVELSDTASVLYFHTFYRPGSWISIPEQTYIQPVGGEKLYIKGTEGIPLNEGFTMPESGEASYKLIFPPIDASVARIDYGEGNDGGNWFIYDIVLKNKPGTSLIPEEAMGNWLNKKNGNWEISFLDSQVVYQSALWKYKEVNLKRGKGYIVLKKGESSVSLYIKTNKDGLQVGLSPKSTESYVKDPAAAMRQEEEPYQTPLFRVDSATYSGYFKNYTSRCGVKTLTVAVDDIITGEQNTFLAEIGEDGFFSVKLPLYHPNLVFVRSGLFNGAVYLEPGKQVFQMIGDEKLFMGECAAINEDLQKTEKVFSFNYNEIQNKILDMTPDIYKEYCQNHLKRDLDRLDAIRNDGNISAKAYQVKRLDLEYRYASVMMEYAYIYESAYRREHNITDRRKEVDIETPGLDYYDFIDEEFANNPYAVLATSYNSFINRLKYLDLAEDEDNVIYYSIDDIIDELKTTGYSFTEEENAMLKLIEQGEAIMQEPDQKAFIEKYETRRRDFYIKHDSLVQNYYRSLSETPNAGGDMEEYLVDNGVALTEDEKEFLSALRAYNELESTKKLMELQSENGPAVGQFWQKHGDITQQITMRKSKEARDKKLKTLIGEQSGFAADIMLAQDFCRGIVAEMTPVSEHAIVKMQQEINTPFIAEYIALSNQRTLAKIEENKQKTGFTVNEVPKTEADRLFDAIMEKYRGKIVYVDFWATWCGPCRSGIERIKPLKQEMSGSDVAFVYITNHTSPAGAWSNMIPEIKGEHYRVTSDEWNYLTSKFNITGIPHYVLVGRSGEILNPNLPHMSNESLKREFEKQLRLE